MSNKEITVIMPVYNEGSYVLGNIIELSKCDFIKEIILVDDGSNEISKKNYEGASNYATVIVHEKNKGKEEALKTALRVVTTKYIMFFDADLTGINTNLIHSAISEIGDAEIIRLARGADGFLFKSIFATAYIIGGEQIITKEFIDKHYTELFAKDWNLEMTINKLILKHKYNFKIIELEGVNHRIKFTKRGVIRGILEDIRMIFKILFINNNVFEILRIRILFSKYIKNRSIIRRTS